MKKKKKIKETVFNGQKLNNGNFVGINIEERPKIRFLFVNKEAENPVETHLVLSEEAVMSLVTLCMRQLFTEIDFNIQMHYIKKNKGGKR